MKMLYNLMLNVVKLLLQKFLKGKTSCVNLFIDFLLFLNVRLCVETIIKKA